MKIKSKKTKTILLILSIIFWIGLLEIVARLLNKPLILPTPTAIFKTILLWLPTEKLWITVFTSLSNVILGTVIGLFLGIMFAIITFNNDILDTLLQPIVVIIKVTPVASFILIMVLWIKRENIPSFISSLMVFPIVFSNIKQGIISVDKSLIEVSNVFNFSYPKKVKYLYFPTLLPYILTAFKSSLGLAWKAGISAEIITIPLKSIGREMSEAKIYLETENLFAWSVVIIILSLIVERIIFSVLELLICKIYDLTGENDA